MKIGGVDPNTLSVEVFLVLPRGNEQQIVFRRRPVKDMDAFEQLCPRPTPPGKLTRDGFVQNENDPTYKQVLAAWAQQRLGYMVMKTLEPSQIEWDTVSRTTPRSWSKLVQGPAQRRIERYGVPSRDESGAGGQLP